MQPIWCDPQPLLALEHEPAYREHYLDLELWGPYVELVCRRHDLAPILPLQTGVAGTYPVFIAGGHWVIKFFGRLFEGGEAYPIELGLAGKLGDDPDFPAPALVAWGELFPNGQPWPWPYLVFEYLPGLSFSEIGSILGRRVRMQLAVELGCLARRIHSLPAPDWSPYLEFLKNQRAGCRERLQSWGWLPDRLLDELDEYLLPPSDLIDPGEQPHWIHGDITGDHLIGRWNHGEWTTLGLVDFGDGRIGSLYYELAALHLGFLGGDGRLLAAFLDAYQYEGLQDGAFGRKALTAALLHQFDVLGLLWRRRFSQHPPDSLQELAVRLWSPGPVAY
jgi:hypothetical protein